MKAILLLVFLTVSTLLGIGQENGTLKINTVHGDRDALTQNRFKYGSFESGTAFSKTAEAVQARLNYNYLTNEILFIAPGGDTLALASPQSYSRIVIKEDSFYFSGKVFLEQVTHYPDYNLFRKRNLELVNDEKKGGYGTYSTTSSTHSISSYNDGRRMQPVSADENLIYQFRDTYFIGDRFQKFHPATKKGFANLFWKGEKELKKFSEEMKVDYNKQEDLEKLLQYIQANL